MSEKKKVREGREREKKREKKGAAWKRFFFSSRKRKTSRKNSLSLSLSKRNIERAAPRIQTRAHRVRITFVVRARKEREREERERGKRTKKEIRSVPEATLLTREISEKEKEKSKTHRRRVCSALSSSPKLPSRHLSSSFPVVVVPELCPPWGWCRSLSSLRAPRPLP